MDCRIIDCKVVARDGSLVSVTPNHFGQADASGCYFGRVVRVDMVGRGGHTSLPPSFLRFPPFLEIQDVPTFYRSFGKTKVMNNSCNQFVYHFYPQSILVLEECLQEW